ncbi:MAG: acyl-CoA dehydratase activase [Chloroflexota bacterium]
MPADALYCAGLDLGSTMTKVVIIDARERIIARVESHTGAEHRRLANRVMEEALAQAGLPVTALSYIVATGYGRINIPFADRQVTELTCHARGVASFFPSARTALDIGGQDAKAMRLGEGGKLLNFVMNDRCAAGTGRFLEVTAGTLGIPLEDLGKLSLASQHPVKISNTCTIFAQQEINAHLSEGAAVEDIVAGLHEAIASRAVALLRRLRVEPEVVFTGGVAKNTGMVRAISRQLGREVLVPEDPLVSGAFGAALLGREIVAQAQAKGEPVKRADRKLTEATFFEQG